MIEVIHHQGRYPIEFLSPSEIVEKLPANRVMIVDEDVARLWPQVTDENGILVPAGEASKSLRQFERIAEELGQRRTKRNATLVALGGGVVGDLAGFVAAAYMRGVGYIQIPTTLLAMVDSSVGGKVGLDLKNGKNLVGSFHAPRSVYIAQDFLTTLDQRQVTNGMAEVLKYGFIADAQLLTGKPDQATIEACVQIKSEIVKQDEFDRTGLRATLNFGHTVGHALEAITGYGPLLHGEAIAIGMVAETRIAEHLNLAERGLAQQVREVMTANGLPTHHEQLSNPALVELMRGDKKVEGDRLAFSFVSRPGTCKLVTDVPESIVLEVLSQS